MSIVITGNWAGWIPHEHPTIGVIISWDTVTMMDTTPTPETPGHPERMSTTEATFGMKKAAEVAGISVSTIRRHKDLLRQCGAIIEPDGWKVPMSALISSGLMRPQTPPTETEPVKQPATTEQYDELTHLKMEVQELRHRAELAEERQRSAEQQARDAREFADSLSETLTIERRMLTAGTTGVEAISSDDVRQGLEASAVDERQEKSAAPGGWWRRLVRG